MSEEDPTPEELLSLVASVMRNPIREPGVTCAVCTTPVDGWNLCNICRQHMAQHPRLEGGPRLADQVVPLTYAIKGTQAYKDAFGYKEIGGHRAAWQRFAVTTALFTVEHSLCIDAAALDRASVFLTVPSLSGRSGSHPLDQLGSLLPARWRNHALAASADLPSDQNARRRPNPDHFVCSSDLRGRHVVIFDDTWTSGGHAQGAAVCARQAGAAYITIVVVARVLNPEFGNTASFVDSRLNGIPYSLSRCPVTGADCPMGMATET